MRPLAPAAVSLSLADGRVLGRNARVLRADRRSLDAAARWTTRPLVEAVARCPGLPPRGQYNIACYFAQIGEVNTFTFTGSDTTTTDDSQQGVQDTPNDSTKTRNGEWSEASRRPNSSAPCWSAPCARPAAR